MNHDVEAIYDHGVFRPIAPLALPEGARVHLLVRDVNSAAAEDSQTTAEYKNWLGNLAGSWQGEFVREDEGAFETRGRLS